jgi:cytochrome c oxidase assembly protein subunit 15
LSSAPASALRRLSAHLAVALVALVAIGGATRVMEAGLACPDWPLCYGGLYPGGRMNMQVFLEWFHRLDAFLVGIALLVMAGLSLRDRDRLPAWLPAACLICLGLVAVQGGLGALTVTRLLDASTVTAHLATALALVLLVSGLHQRLRIELPPSAGPPPAPLPAWWRPLALVAGLPLLGQCLLGGAMASRWAADRCLAAGEECAWLGLHRLVAWPAAAALVLLALACLALPPGHRGLKGLVAAAAALVPLQVFLGILTMRLQLDVAAVTVAHQLLAALLVALIGAVWGRTLSAPRMAGESLSPLEVVHG